MKVKTILKTIDKLKENLEKTGFYGELKLKVHFKSKAEYDETLKKLGKTYHQYGRFLKISEEIKVIIIWK